MRRVFIMMIVLLHSTASVAVAGANSSTPLARSSELDVIGLNQITLHQDELVEVLFTLHNTGEDDNTYSFQLESEVSGLNATGLPHTKFVESGYLRQVKFNLTTETSTPFGVYNFSLNFTSQNDLSWYQIETFQATVAPYSNLNFGVTGISTFIVTPGIRTSVAMNITNNATLADDITFNLYSQTGWNWGWTMDSTGGENAYETLQPDSLTYVFLWIDIPPIVDGAPLSNTGPRFQMKAVSGIDGAISQWSFDLLMDDFYNVTIDSNGDDILLEPGGNNRIPITIRNNGNTPNLVNISLEAISENGDPIEGIPIDDRITYDGWTMALFGGLESNMIDPNDSRTIEIGFLAPMEYSGEIDIRLRVFANGALSRMRTIDVGASIDWQRSGSVQLLSDSCNYLLPNESCDARIAIENLGNAVDSYEFTLTEVPEFVEAELLLSTTEINPNEIIELTLLNITANSSAYAFELDDVVVEIRLLDSDTLIGIARIPVKIAPVIKWVFTDIVEEVDSQGRLSIAMTLRNEGNTADGLLVQMQSSHSTEMSFIPPFIAIYEEDIEFPRSFEVSDIPIGYNFTVRAWIDLPLDQQSNGTVWVNTTVRSQFEPSTLFTHTSKGDYIGIPWQESEVEDSFDFVSVLNTGWDIFKSWFLMLCAVLFSGIIIYKSIIARNERNLEQQQLDEMHRKKDPEVVDDWMGKFSETKQVTHEDMALKVNPEHFQEAFQNRAGTYKPTNEPVNPALTQAANTVLDFHSSNDLRDSADSLLQEIQSGNISMPHADNEALKTSAPDISEKKSVESQSVPLPSDEDVDELDI
ncbi:MAG: hypothetical protein HOA11_01405 [Euryarchaeota archaeon]|nr:hypothetical protein [Euryarchaeota archaeon]